MKQRMERLWLGLRGRILAFVVVLLLAAVGVAGVLAYQPLADPDSDRIRIGYQDMVLLELAGSEFAARELVCHGLDVSAPEAADTGPALRPSGTDTCASQVEYYQNALGADLLLIGSYLVSLGGLCLVGSSVCQTDRARSVTRLAAEAVLLIAAVDLAKNRLIDAGLEGLLDDGTDAVWRWAAAAAVIKFTLLLPVLITAATVLLIVPARAMMRSADFGWVRTPADVAPDDATVIPPSPVVDDDGKLWPPGGAAKPTPEALSRDAAEVGICVSGGGIRSGTATLGALHQLRHHGILGRARYLVSVSGGGYASGAWQLALRRHPDEADRTDSTVVDPATVFAPDSPELDHIRRHGRYVADNPAQWLVALGTLLRGVLVSLGLLVGLVTLVGIALGRFYLAVPFFYQASLPLPPEGQQPPAFSSPTTGVTTAVLTLVALGFGVWLLSVFVLTRKRFSAWLRLLAKRIFIFVAAVAILGLLIPLVVWAYVRLAWWIFGDQEFDAGSLVAGSSAGGIGLAYIGALVSILWRRREKFKTARRWLSPAGGTVQRHVPRSILQMLIVWLVLLVLGLLYGALLTAVTLMSMESSTFDLLTWWDGAPVHFWPHWYVVVVPLIFVAVALLVDQTWMSLHAFYRRRLSSAFAVRRRRRRDGVEYAEPYDFDAERTELGTYAERVRDPNNDPTHPQVIFAAAAQLSGFARVPPGRRAVSYTFSHDWIGGPQVGYVRTAALREGVLGDAILRDITVQSAMAVSGAAFASAMGRESTPYQTLLALSNARLGTWLPNPAWLSERAGPDGWAQPRLPRIRRLTYLLREVAGVFDPANRFLLITDGGHYENLGLVELLRQRCRTVYCIDASGDSPPLATTLGNAIALAKEELGVTIELDKPLDLVPGSADPLTPKDPLADLSARLSKAVVVTGEVSYPEPFQVAGEPSPSAAAKLILVKTRLHPDLPVEVLSYAQQHPTFPNDSTSDQWFDEGQFNAYYELGRFLGDMAADPSRRPAVDRQSVPRLDSAEQNGVEFLVRFWRAVRQSSTRKSAQRGHSTESDGPD